MLGKAGLENGATGLGLTGVLSSPVKALVMDRTPCSSEAAGGRSGADWEFSRRQEAPEHDGLLSGAAVPSCLQGNDLEQVQDSELPNCVCLVTLVACEMSAQGGTSVPDNYAWHVPADLSLTGGLRSLGTF